AQAQHQVGRYHRERGALRDGAEGGPQRRKRQGGDRRYRQEARSHHEELIRSTAPAAAHECAAGRRAAQDGAGSGQMTTAVLASPARARAFSLQRQYALLGMLLIAPTILVFCTVIVYPLITAIYLSLFSIY